jgi:predicted metalloprotease with PDZ domain
MSEQYYTGGAMIWLDVDCKIRQLTNDKKSLDTFAREFYGMDNGSFVTKTYTFDQLVAGLDHVVKYDWASFLRNLLDQHKPPLAGIEASGWKVVYTGTPSAAEKAMAQRLHFHPHNFSTTIGLSVGGDGTIRDVLWNGPAFKAGVGSGETLVAVNGKAWSSDVLGDAIKSAASDKQPIKLLLKYQGHFQSVSVPYYGGPKYAHLERIKGKPDYLDEIIQGK